MASQTLFSPLRCRGCGLDAFLFVVLSCSFVAGQIRYSVPEEMKKGSLIGNVAQDLGLDLKRLRTGRAHIVAGENTQYAELKIDKGILVVKERIDREQLCGDITPCSFSFEIILENPIELHRVIVEITDVNDHSPTFQNDDLKFEISESAVPGSRFVLESADDPDVGLNALQRYFLTSNDYFVLKEHANPDGTKFAEMVIQKVLDREEHPYLSLKLIAVDGGDPQRSGTVNIDVTVLDANDNVPVFNQTEYRASVIENARKGTYVTTVNATDADSGSNGKITYYFSKLKGNVADMFSIDENSGLVSVLGQIDYEKDKRYEIRVEAKDQGGLTDSSKIIIEVIDVNDNAPIISVMSFSSTISEDAPPGTTVAVIKIKDYDSDDNGRVTCSINEGMPFQVISSLSDYYNLITDAYFDRETVAEYNITVIAIDSGSPPLSSSATLRLSLSDVNDNAPVFEKRTYSVYVSENNSPGLSLFTVSARDSDWHQNARISYFLAEQQIGGTPVSSLLSINAETGVLHAVRSFDYEQVKQFSFIVKAQDGGSPPLSSNATINVLIKDQNDNAPQVLYPVQTGGSVVAEMVPRSADVGYLVAKVVAVDVDSGQNAWLSYKLQKATDRALFEVGAQNGEIRTVRQVTDKDAVKQKLTVVVQDNGQPSRSATVNINVAVADSFPEVLSEFPDFTHDKDYNDNLTFYLVLALAVVSFLFVTCLVIIISVKIYRWRQSRIFYQSSLPVIPYYPPRYADAGGTGTLRHLYNYDVYRTTESRKSDCEFVRPCSQNVLVVDPSCTGTTQRQICQKSVLDETDSPVEIFSYTIDCQIRYSVPEEMKRGSLIGNVAQDLGLDLKRLQRGRARIVTEDSTQYAELKPDKGILVVSQRIDREQLCGEITPCSFSFEIILENPMELHQVTVEITDINDNSPLFRKNQMSFEISESAALGSRFALATAEDPDVGINALQNYILTKNDHFLIKQHSNPDGSKYAEMVLQKALDREEHPQLSLKLIAVDGGNPQRSGTINVDVTVLDVNDNAPVFNQTVYKATVMENAGIGTYITTVNATDTDSGSNGEVSYLFSNLKEHLAEIFHIDGSSGVVTVAGNIDFEKDKRYEIRVEAKDQGGLTDTSKIRLTVKAQDGGSPPLSSNATVNILIQDQNDNAPQVLYPVQTGGSVVAEMVPRSADVGYLVTKVVAVDVDSGQNAWLSYKLQKATDRALFEVGAQNGEIRTVRQVTDKDAVKQKLTVVVADNGQPSRSATVNINVAVADSFPEVLSEFPDFTHDKDYNDNLTFYLVLALAVVSFLFIVSIIAILSVKCYRWRRERMFYKSGANLPVIPYYPPLYADVGGTGTLQHVYNYEVCRTTDSRKSDLKYARPSSESIISLDTSGSQTLTHMQRQKLASDSSHDQFSVSDSVCRY
ncbi:hypothetical protein MHYP_G00175970 [Metynnis hypsauchen]